MYILRILSLLVIYCGGSRQLDDCKLQLVNAWESLVSLQRQHV